MDQEILENDKRERHYCHEHDVYRVKNARGKFVCVACIIKDALGVEP